ncbi:hypothetical protein COBT_000308 [Conglomerata obtusa]
MHKYSLSSHHFKTTTNTTKILSSHLRSIKNASPVEASNHIKLVASLLKASLIHLNTDEILTCMRQREAVNIECADHLAVSYEEMRQVIYGEIDVKRAIKMLYCELYSNEKEKKLFKPKIIPLDESSKVVHNGYGENTSYDVKNKDLYEYKTLMDKQEYNDSFIGEKNHNKNKMEVHNKRFFKDNDSSNASANEADVNNIKCDVDESISENNSFDNISNSYNKIEYYRDERLYVSDEIEGLHNEKNNFCKELPEIIYNQILNSNATQNTINSFRENNLDKKLDDHMKRLLSIYLIKENIVFVNKKIEDHELIIKSSCFTVKATLCQNLLTPIWKFNEIKCKDLENTQFLNFFTLKEIIDFIMFYEISLQAKMIFDKIKKLFEYKYCKGDSNNFEFSVYDTKIIGKIKNNRILINLNNIFINLDSIEQTFLDYDMKKLKDDQTNNIFEKNKNIDDGESINKYFNRNLDEYSPNFIPDEINICKNKTVQELHELKDFDKITDYVIMRYEKEIEQNIKKEVLYKINDLNEKQICSYCLMFNGNKCNCDFNEKKTLIFNFVDKINYSYKTGLIFQNKKTNFKEIYKTFEKEKEILEFKIDIPNTKISYNTMKNYFGTNNIFIQKEKYFICIQFEKQNKNYYRIFVGKFYDLVIKSIEIFYNNNFVTNIRKDNNGTFEDLNKLIKCDVDLILYSYRIRKYKFKINKGLFFTINKNDMIFLVKINKCDGYKIYIKYKIINMKYNLQDLISSYDLGNKDENNISSNNLFENKNNNLENIINYEIDERSRNQGKHKNIDRDHHSYNDITNYEIGERSRNKGKHKNIDRTPNNFLTSVNDISTSNFINSKPNTKNKNVQFKTIDDDKLHKECITNDASKFNMKKNLLNRITNFKYVIEYDIDNKDYNIKEKNKKGDNNHTNKSNELESELNYYKKIKNKLQNKEYINFEATLGNMMDVFKLINFLILKSELEINFEIKTKKDFFIEAFADKTKNIYLQIIFDKNINFSSNNLILQNICNNNLQLFNNGPVENIKVYLFRSLILFALIISIKIYPLNIYKNILIIETNKVISENIKILLFNDNKLYLYNDKDMFLINSKEMFRMIRYIYLQNRFMNIYEVCKNKYMIIEESFENKEGYYKKDKQCKQNMKDMQQRNKNYLRKNYNTKINNEMHNNNRISSNKISNNNMSNNKIGGNKISGNKIISNKISSNKISSNKISSNKLKNEKYNNDRINSNKIINDKHNSNNKTKNNNTKMIEQEFNNLKKIDLINKILHENEVRNNSFIIKTNLFTIKFELKDKIFANFIDGNFSDASYNIIRDVLGYNKEFNVNNDILTFQDKNLDQYKLHLEYVINYENDYLNIINDLSKLLQYEN